MASGSNIGIMDAAYFVGRKEILSWLNGTFSLSLSKIEETAPGAVACQIADAVFPGEVPMSKVKWDARSEYEFIHNYKILQQVFAKKGVNKHVEVERLIRAKYQDNLEFMQWMKRWYELNCSGDDYDAVARRRKNKSAPRASKAKPAAAAAAAAAAPRAARGAARGAGRGAAAAENSAAAANRRVGAKRVSKPDPQIQAKLDDANAQVAELKVSVDGLEKERDFYFGKLRDIEILLQSYTGEDKALTDSIFKILYATEDDFVVVDEDEEAKAGEPVDEDLRELEPEVAAT